MKVLIVDDHPLVRKGLLSALAMEDGIIVMEASNVEEAVRLISRQNPDIAIIDLRLGNENGLEIVSSVKAQKLSTRFIVLTSSSKKEDFLHAQNSGVEGYILKESFIEDIVYAFHVVARGKKFIDPEVLHFRTDETVQNMDMLTVREQEVLYELGKGLCNNQIASELFISEHTVKKHISCILSKLGLNHRTEAALYANNLLTIRN
jgi:DNA-binding NarL/FixJ family response regulator